ncbi:MAG: tetratricopeptide repeat protein [Planctomycetia bacterium]
MSGMTTGRPNADVSQGRVLAWAMIVLAGTVWCGVASAQSPDRVLTTEGTFTGKVVGTSSEAVDLEERSGDTRKIPVDQLREVQFGGEPQSLRAARSLLSRGRASDAVEEVAKIEAAELDGAEPLLLDEVDFVKAAAAGRAALAAGGDPKDAGRLVSEFLTKHPKSHHFYDMQQLLGDLLFRAGKPDAALTAYSTLAKGPAALKVRAAAAKAGMLFDQQKFVEAMAEYDAALKIEASDDASAEQKRSAQLGKARCLAQTGKNAEAVALVQGIIKQADPEEKDLLGRAYNVLGAAYRAAGDKDQDALISYLTVDLVYNGSPDSHAEALANLAELWDKVKQNERAREARKLLQESYPASPWAKKQAAPAGA